MESETMTCDLCDKTVDLIEDWWVVTEDGYEVGECCRHYLRVEGYMTEFDSETFYYAY